MDLEIIILSEVRERQTQYDIACTWNPKYDTNEPIYKTETDSDVEIRLVVVKGEVGKESEDLGIWGCLM